jgi:hypothetical protein
LGRARKAGAGQQIGGRGEGVGVRAPDVDLAVAGLVDAEAQIGVRHELGLAHGPGPAAFQARAFAAAVDDDVERVLEFALGPVAAAAVVSEGGQRANDVIVALDGPEGALIAPDRDKDFGRHAESLGHFPRHAVGAGPALGDAGGRGGGLDIGPGGAAEFGLVAVEANDRGVRGQAGELALVLCAASAAVAGEEALFPAVEARLVDHDRRGRRRARRGGSGYGGAGCGRGGVRGRSHRRRLRQHRRAGGDGGD